MFSETVSSIFEAPLVCCVRGCVGKFRVFRMSVLRSDRIEHEVSPGKFIHYDVPDQDMMEKGVSTAMAEAIEKIAASGHPGYIPPDER